jgi:hypothetical protein
MAGGLLQDKRCWVLSSKRAEIPTLQFSRAYSNMAARKRGFRNSGRVTLKNFMKKLLTFCLCAMTSGVFAQGLINFFNNANTLVSVGFVGPYMWTPGSYYFALLTSPVGANTFTFANVYGTNQAAAGRFNGGANVQVAGWASGTARDFEVFGWSNTLGPTFNPAWLTSFPSFPFGISALGTGQAGGFNGIGTLPSLNIFGGATGIQTGFILGALIPEPPPQAWL